MVEKINKLQNVQTEKISPQTISQNATVSFQQLLDKETIKFSAHAKMRLENRHIVLSNEQMSKLNDAISRAESKGAKESLILMDSTAFVVSVKNKTVITAIGEDSLKENVITNIDSAVIVK